MSTKKEALSRLLFYRLHIQEQYVNASEFVHFQAFQPFCNPGDIHSFLVFFHFSSPVLLTKGLNKFILIPR